MFENKSCVNYTLNVLSSFSDREYLDELSACLSSLEGHGNGLPDAERGICLGTGVLGPGRQVTAGTQRTPEKAGLQQYSGEVAGRWPREGKEEKRPLGGRAADGAEM